MASKVLAGFRRILFTLVLLPWVIADPQLMINNRMGDFQLSTKPNHVASLWCTVQNHTQGEELVWFREDSKVQLKDGNKVNASNICISPVSAEDNGVSFTCKLARDGSINVSVELNVTFCPNLGGEAILSVQEETDATLDCHSKANPPVQMTWLKDNHTLALEKSRHQIYQTSELFQLTIKKAQKADSGIYTCQAECSYETETEGTVRTVRKDFHLTVKDRELPFPMEAVIAASVVVFLTLLFGVVARRERILKCFKNTSHSPRNTSL